MGEVDPEGVIDLGHVIVDHQEEDQEAVVLEEDREPDQEVDLKKDQEHDRLQNDEKKVEVDPDDEATDLDQTVDVHDLRKNYCTRTTYWNLCIQLKSVLIPSV